MKYIIGKYIYDTEQSEFIGGTMLLLYDMITVTLYRTKKLGRYYLTKEKGATKECTCVELSEMDALNWSVKHLSQTIVMDKFGDILEIA